MKLPPFAKRIVQVRQAGQVPLRRGFGQVCIVCDWNRTGSAALPRVVVPDDGLYQMGFLAGLDVLLIDGGEPHAAGVLAQVKRVLPHSLTVAHMDGARLKRLEPIC